MNFKIINGNCLKELEKINDNAIDHTITSPPYNMNLRVSKDKYCSRQIVKEFSTKYDGFNDNLKMSEYFDFHKKTIYELLRVTKGYIFYIIQPVTGNKPSLYKLLGEFNENIKEVIIWDKNHGQPAMANGVLNSCFEFIFVFSKDKVNAMKRQFINSAFNRGTLDNIWRIKRSRSSINKHSATFPEELINIIIKNFTKENDTILDPFSGTGTTGICSLKYNRKYIGIELVKEYADHSVEKLSELIE